MDGVWVLHGEVVNYEEVRDYLYRDTDYFYDWLADYFGTSALIEHISRYERVDEAIQDLCDKYVDQWMENIAGDPINDEICFIPYAKSYK